MSVYAVERGARKARKIKDTPQQAELRRKLAERGNRVAPRVNPSTGESAGTAQERRETVLSAGTRNRAAGTPRQRRDVVLAGTAESGSTGRSDGSTGTRGTGTRGRGRGSATPSLAGPRGRSRSRSGRAFKSLTGRESGGILLAEYFGAVVIIVLGLFTKGPGQGYHQTMADIMLRLTALTGIFFILFLLAGTKGGKAAVWFGLLVDLGVIFTATRENVLTDTANIVAGKGTGVDTATLTAATKEPEPTPPELPDV